MIWQNTSTGGSVRIVSEYLFGRQALELSKNSSGTPRASQSVEVKAGSTYIVSGYIKNVNTVGEGAYIDIRSGDPSSFIINNRSDAVKETLEYTYHYVKFKALANTTILIDLVNKTSGKAYFDMIQMNADVIDLRNNYLNNSSFENGSTGWNNSTNYIANNNLGLFDLKMYGNKYLKLKNGSVSQKVYINGFKDDIYVYGGSAFFDNDIARGKINLTFSYNDGTIGSYEFSFDHKDKNIQYLMKKAIALKDYSKITITITNLSSNWDVYIDNIALYKEGYGLDLTYNDDGDIEAVHNEITNSNIEYEYSNGVIKTIKEDNIITEVERVNNTKWIDYVVTNNVIQSFSYDINGNIEEFSLASKIVDPNNPDKYIPDIYLNSSSTISSADKLYKVREIDEYDRITDYTFDYLTGLLTDTTYNGRTVSKEYDSLQNLTKVTQGARTVEYVYDKLLLHQIKVGGLVYEFEYNDYNDVVSIKIAGNTILENSYKDELNSKYSGLIEETTYGEDIFRFTYDQENRIKEVYVNNTKQIEYKYDSMGNIAEAVDYKVNPSITYYYNYDQENRLITILSTDGNKITYDYNPEDSGFLSSKTNINGKVDYSYTSLDMEASPEGKDKNQVISSEVFNNDVFRKEYNYQSSGLNKLESTAIITSAASITSNYTYDSFQKTVDGDLRSYETLRIKELDIKRDGTSLIRLVYTYDNFDNIKTIHRHDNGSTSYSSYEYFNYNEYNELTYHAQVVGLSVSVNTYTYDIRGNVTSIEKVVHINGFQHSYSYIVLNYDVSGWLDKLTSVTVDGITYLINGYDTLGNPRFYRGFEIDYIQRSITKIEEPISGDTYTYKYNSSNIRVEKHANGVTTNYILDGSIILQEVRSDGKVLKYYYDKNESIIGFNYNDNDYFYLKNLQNDIIGITNSNGSLIVKYIYDAYGNIISITDTSGLNLGIINPFRFKSYYYDEETKFYYLNSRYYDPFIGRFINADDIGMLAKGELNLFAYCENNPVMYSDSTGTSPKWWQSILIGAGVIVGAALVGAAIAVTFGAATPFLTIVGTSIVGGLKIAAVTGLTAGAIRTGTSVVDSVQNGVEFGEALANGGKSFVTGFADGFLAGSMYAGASMIVSPLFMAISGSFNNGYGWEAGKWIGGYQTPKTPGISIATFLGGINGGRSFGLDLDMYNGLHVHSKHLGKVKNHNWWIAPVMIGIGVGFSKPYSEW